MGNYAANLLKIPLPEDINLLIQYENIGMKMHQYLKRNSIEFTIRTFIDKYCHKIFRTSGQILLTLT